jgi:hypothetical protein
MGRRERGTAAVEWLTAMHKLMHPATEIVRWRSVEMRLMLQFVARGRVLRC